MTTLWAPAYTLVGLLADTPTGVFPSHRG
jgi:hypothetical protein